MGKGDPQLLWVGYSSSEEHETFPNFCYLGLLGSKCSRRYFSSWYGTV